VTNVPEKDDRPVRGRRVVAKVTYCGHTIRAEAELNDRDQWIGGGVVVRRDFEAALPLTTPRPTPGEALDVTVMAGMRWVDERRDTSIGEG
jgi:hypothetical protein